jgi:HlyD family secretion protein
MTEPTNDIAATLAAARPARHRLRFALWLVLAAALLAVAGFILQQRLSAGSAATYITAPVTRGPLTVTVTATGTIQPTTQVDVSSELSGTLVSVEADFNDRVEVGQVLARLDDTKLRAQVANAEAALAAARARVRQADASAREAKENYESEAALDQRGVTSRRSFVGFEALYNRAEAQRDIARADEATAEANLVLQKADLEKSVIRSPIRGVVLGRTVDAGQIVASSLNTPTLFTLAEDLSRMELRVDVDEADIGRVAVGNEATFTVDAYSGRSFPATITEVRFAPETTNGVVTYKAVLAVDNSDLALRPGMTATATIVVRQIDDTLQVPNAALRYAPPVTAVATTDEGGSGGLLGLIIPDRPAETVAAQGGDAVWILRDGAPLRVEIDPGDTDGKSTAIIGGDLIEGDLVITDQSEAG